MVAGPQPQWLIGVESRLLDRIRAAVMVTSFDGTVLYANPYCEVLYGRSPEELSGQPSGDFAAAPLEASTLNEIGAALLSGQSWEGDFGVVRKDGAVIEVHAVNSPLFDDAGVVAGVVSIAFDITRRREMENLLSEQAALAQAIRSVGEALTAQLTVEQVADKVIEAALDLTGATFAAFLFTDARQSSRFVGAGTVPAGVARGPSTRDALTAFEFDAQDAVSLDSLANDPRGDALERFLRASCGDIALGSATVAVVRSIEGEVIGVIVVAHALPSAFDSNARQLAAALGSQAGVAIENARLHDAARHEIGARRRAEAAQRFLAETSAVLASSLAFPENFENLARLSVPFLGDLCVVDVADGAGIRRVAAIHADPSKQHLVTMLEQRYAPEPYGPHPAASVVRGGRSEYSPEMSEEFLRSTTRDDEHLRIVHDLEFTSYLCVPLTARGRILGALTLVSSGSGRRFSVDDLALAEEFARRAALVLDNARLYSERDHVARALQASLLPPSLPRIPGVEVAARYVAAGEGNEVGGDFYDVFQVRRNNWCFLVGDVSGKGPEAAAIAGLARHTLRAAAILARRPTQMLQTLHEAMRNDEASADRFCTVCCGLLRRTDTGVDLRVSCGGHPLPFIARADGTVENLDCRGTLLGLAHPVQLQDKTVQLGPGDVFVLYTDGAIEAHRRADDLFGEERLGALIGESASQSADRIADHLLAAVLAFGPAEPRDDVAILVAKVDPRVT